MVAVGRSALAMCGVKDQRYPFTETETSTLRALQRGAFVNRPVRAGEKLSEADLFYAIPNSEGQIVANDLSKYADFYAPKPLEPGQAARFDEMRSCNSREQIYRIVSDVKKMLKRSKVIVPGQLELEISHHYGLDNFARYGSTIITVVNREYCKRVIVLVPGQTHPEQYHKQKDETYHILHGDIALTLDGVDSRQESQRRGGDSPRRQGMDSARRREQ